MKKKTQQSYSSGSIQWSINLIICREMNSLNVGIWEESSANLHTGICRDNLLYIIWVACATRDIRDDFLIFFFSFFVYWKNARGVETIFFFLGIFFFTCLAMSICGALYLGLIALSLRPSWWMRGLLMKRRDHFIFLKVAKLWLVGERSLGVARVFVLFFFFTHWPILLRQWFKSEDLSPTYRNVC